MNYLEQRIDLIAKLEANARAFSEANPDEPCDIEAAVEWWRTLPLAELQWEWDNSTKMEER